MDSEEILAKLIKTSPNGIRRAVPYIPGKPIEELKREKGFDDSVTIVKLASNENPLGPSKKALSAIRETLPFINLYPDAGAYNLKEKLSNVLNVSSDRIIVGNGSENILDLCARSLLRVDDEVVVSEFSFPQFTLVATLAGANIKIAPTKSGLNQSIEALVATISKNTRMVILGNPDNPTGSILSSIELESLVSNLPSTCILIVDEAYHGLISDTSHRSTLCGPSPINDGDRPIITTRTFSKAYGLAGLRVGYAVMPSLLVRWVDKARLPFNVNALAQAAACASLDDEAHVIRSREVTTEGRKYLVRECRNLNLDVIEGAANFILVDVSPRNSSEVAEKLLNLGIIVRPLTHPKLSNYLRVSVGLEEENKIFIAGLSS